MAIPARWLERAGRCVSWPGRWLSEQAEPVLWGVSVVLIGAACGWLVAWWSTALP